MRDPLGRIPISYKLPLGFLAVCLVVFGIGGVVLMSEARRALETEIDQRLNERSTAVALIVERHVDLLRQRARDFASDGLIRQTFHRLTQAPRDDASNLEVARRLTTHFETNKLPLVDTVVGAVLCDTRGEVGLAVPSKTVGDEAIALAQKTVVGALQPASNNHPYPTFCVATPLWSQSTHTCIGSMQLVVRADQWVRGINEFAALPPLPLRFMRLVDSTGVSLPLAATTLPVETTDDPTYQRPLATAAWNLELAIDRELALSPARKLRDQYLWIGLGLLLATAAVLYFPIRFLLRPLSRVADAARRVTEGDFTARVDHDARDEMGDLANAFNLMTSAIADRTGQLEDAAAAVRKREQDVRIERDRLGAVIHSMEDGLFILDAEGKVTLANARARPLVNALAHASMDRLECARTHLVPSQCLVCLAEPDHGQQACIVEHDGRIYDIHTTALPAAPGRDGGRLCVSRDVTERIHQQESQAHQERMAVLGEVAAVMAHELNNPLAAISMFSEMMEEQLPGDHPLLESATVIRRNVAACSRTIHGLLDLAARGRPEIAPFEMDALLEDVAELLRPIYQRAKVTLEHESHTENTVIVGDELRLRQVLVNLVMNAVQACPVGGAITVQLSDRSDYLVLDVHDNGVGISEEHRARIFEPFFTTKGPGSGTGLGLSTSRRIVEEHGGTLECLAVETGTTFRVRLPRKAARRAWEAQARLNAEVSP